jgi:hypothetical protein
MAVQSRNAMSALKLPPATRTRRAGMLALLLALLGGPAAAAEITSDRIDLGPAPSTGAAAFGSIGIRAEAVVNHLACGREFEFFGKADDTMGDVWPALIGKVQFLVTRPGEPCTAQVPYGVRDGTDPVKPFIEPFTNQRWAEPLDASTKTTILNGINQVFKSRVTNFGNAFGDDCGTAATDILPAPAPDKPALIEFRLTPGCLRAQVNSVLATRDRSGTNPGSDGLTCHVKGKAAKGDWDMKVYQLTRLVHLARGDRTLFAPSTLRKLEQLLTLSGALQGESYGLYQCGNPDNTTGSAQERADEADFYDDGFFSDVGDLLEWLAAFLAIVLIAVAAAIAVAAVSAGALPMGMLGAALAAAAAAAGLALPIVLIRIEETENHLLMINTSKYLMNQMIVDQLVDEDDKETFRSYNDGIREWLLSRLQRIVEDDFVEYNSRPYQGFSIGSILNIHDFAADDSLKTAAASVLDLAATKMALGSSMGRRIVPFRRLAGTNARFAYGENPAEPKPQRLFDLGFESDHLIAVMLLWAGQVHHTGERMASLGAASEMAFAATSDYRPHELILAVAVEKGVQYEQWIHHAGWEHYSGSKGWLLTAGGTSTGFAQTALVAPFSLPFTPPLGAELGFLKDENRGAGVPTTLLPHSTAVRQDRYTDFLRFEGMVRLWKKDSPDDPQPISFEGNLCLDRGFACGIRLIVPPAVEPCLTRFADTPMNLFFIDSAACGPWADAARFFVVVYRQQCSLGYELCKGGKWGFIEAVDTSPGQTLQDFASATVQRNAGRFSSWEAAGGGDGIDSLAYVSWGSGTILFDPDLHDSDSDATGILLIDGGQDPRGELENWDRASGDILNYSGDARVTIGRPNDPRRIEIDFNDVNDPKRVLPVP